MAPRSKSPIALEAPIPILRIYDVKKAREFYVGFLEMKVDWEHAFEKGGAVYMQVSRDACRLQLSEHFGDGTPGTKIKVPTKGLDAYQKKLLAQRYRHSRPGILDQTWGEREMGISDPFGNVITFFERIT
jgi:catechol 2,3-dioxygenase-like lactoylglutathione lyase family enzyme